VLALAVVSVVLTPITTDAGEWLYDLRKQPSRILREHAERGGWMIYFSVAMLVIAILIAVLACPKRPIRQATCGRQYRGRHPGCGGGDFVDSHRLPHR
jgi:hypothetical protein